MTKPKSTPTEINLTDPQYYFNRELSWLEFNRRVLASALDERTPLLERLKFTAIFSNNLDEFFMVRVAGLKQQVAAGVTKRTPDGRNPSEQLQDISKSLAPIAHQQDHHFEKTLRLQLAKAGVHIVNYVDLNQEQRSYLHSYFEEYIFPVLTPLAVDPSHPFPYISNLSLNLAVVVRNPETDEELFARIKVPKVLPRFVSFPPELRQQQKDKTPSPWTGIPLEQVIAHNLDALFPGMNVQECHPFRITRNADLAVEEDEADDLLLAIEQEIRKRRFGGSTVRIEIHTSTPENIRSMLMQEMGLEEVDVYDLEGLLGLGDLMSLLSLPLPDLKDPHWSPVIPSRLQKSLDGGTVRSQDPEDGDSFFEVIRKGDLLLHHPYHSFSGTVQQFVKEAACDPHVLAIKMTLYRTSGDSPIVNALVSAAENGKQVAVLVELKARFDEENNILWARTLEQAGVHVVYGLMGLKTHTKVTLVVRQEGKHLRRYVHIGTGNYNPKTAKLYTDFGLLSCREDLGADLTDLFNFLTGYSRQRSYRQLIVAPVNLRDRMTGMIERETKNALQGKSGRIVAKMNSLVDQKIIAKLYEASQAGVQIDLIIRGICCLRPGVEKVSENIRVISIIGRLLEHSRVSYFYNGGDEEVYIGSADWMPRNLDRRIEAIAPIQDPNIAKELEEILGIMLADNRQAWDLQSDGSYIQRHPPKGSADQSTQQVLMDMATSASGER